MKRLFYLIGFTTISSLCSKAQDFSGYRSGNYTGVNGVFFNPASIADSRYRFDLNLLSASVSAGNDKASFNLKSIGQSFNSDSLKAKLFGAGAGTTSGMGNVDVHGPSLMFNANRKVAIALTTRFRSMVNVMDFDGRLANQILTDVNDRLQFPYSVSSNEDMRLVANSWSEFGFSYARILKEHGTHFFKAGASIKYLAGVANGYINIANFKSTLNVDATAEPYLAQTTGRLTTGFGGVSISNLTPSEAFKFQGSGFGADIGFVYEYRPFSDGYMLSDGEWQRDHNKYKLRLSVSALDIGRIKYDRDLQRSGSYNIDITGSERLYLRDIERLEVNDYNTFFKSRPQFFTALASNETTYNVSLPTSAQIDVDYHIGRGFYASLAALLPMSKDEVANNSLYSSYTLTPRYEGRAFGVYLPVNYNSLTNFNAGVSLRLGPVFVGSGSLLTALLGDSKQADVHFGIHLAGLHKNIFKKREKEEESK